MARRPFVAIVVCCCFVAASVRAQAATGKTEQPEKPDLAAKQALLQRTLQKMAALSSCEFTAQLERTRLPVQGRAANAVGGGAGTATATVVVAGPAASTGPAMTAGGWAEGLLWAGSNDDKYRMVWRGRRMIARLDQKAWKLRQGVIDDGAPMPRSFDPETFFAALSRGKFELLAAEVGSLDDRPTEILTLHAAGEEACELLWSGLLPDPVVPGWLGVRNMSGPRQVRVRPELDIDVAIWLDPAQARAQQIKVRCYSKSGVGAGTMIAAAGLPGAAGAGGAAPPAGGEQPAAEPADSQPEPLTIEHGLPVRKPKAQEQLGVVTYDVMFARHDAATPPALDANARELLGLPPAK